MPKKAQHKWHQHTGLKCQQITANSHLHMSWNTQRPLLRATALYSKEETTPKIHILSMEKLKMQRFPSAR